MLNIVINKPCEHHFGNFVLVQMHIRQPTCHVFSLVLTLWYYLVYAGLSGNSALSQACLFSAEAWISRVSHFLQLKHCCLCALQANGGVIQIQVLINTTARNVKCLERSVICKCQNICRLLTGPYKTTSSLGCLPLIFCSWSSSTEYPLEEALKHSNLSWYGSKSLCSGRGMHGFDRLACCRA